MQVIERVVAKWRKDGLGVNPGASEEELRRLELCFGAPLPPDFCFYLTLANGLSDDAPDEHFVSWWPIERIVTEATEVVASSPRLRSGDLPIADVMINSWFVVLRSHQGGGVGVFVEGALLELPSVTAFFAAYENEPLSLCL